MLLKFKWTTSVVVRDLPNELPVTVLPWQVVDVKEETAQSLKDIYWNSVWEDVDTNNYDSISLSRTLTLTSAQVLALNTTRLQLVPAPWVWKAIAVESVAVALDYWSVAYATNTDMYIVYDTTNPWDWLWANVLANPIDAVLLATADLITVSRPQVDEVTIVQNQWVSVMVWTWDPTDWDSPIKITVFYKIISLS
jgi:hypothetical protein